MIRQLALLALLVCAGLVRPAIVSAPPTTTIASDDQVRRWILASWCQVDYDLDPDKRPKLDMAVYQRVGPIVVREVLSSSTKEPILLAGALSTLQYLQVPPGSFSDLIRPHLKSADWYVRCMAVEALGAIGSAEDAPWLVPLLDDQIISDAAMLALGKLGTSKELPALRAWRDRARKHDAGLTEAAKWRIEELERHYQEAIRRIEARAAAAVTRPALAPSTRPTGGT